MIDTNRNFKIVCQDRKNNDQYLLGFFDTKWKAIDSIPEVFKENETWIGEISRLLVKPVDPAMIEHPVNTDYMHYCRSLIPNDEWKRVIMSDASAEIDCNNMMCGGQTYYNLSRMIPKDWTTIDIGCAYNPQSYFFAEHCNHIAVNPPDMSDDFHFEEFVAPGTKHFSMTGQKFIRDILPTLGINIKKTFAIMNFVPDYECLRMVRDTFANLYCFYPA